MGAAVGEVGLTVGALVADMVGEDELGLDVGGELVGDVCMHTNGTPIAHPSASEGEEATKSNHKRGSESAYMLSKHLLPFKESDARIHCMWICGLVCIL